MSYGVSSLVMAVVICGRVDSIAAWVLGSNRQSLLLGRLSGVTLLVRITFSRWLLFWTNVDVYLNFRVLA